MSNKKIYIIEDDINLASALEALFRVNGMETGLNDGSGSIEEIINYLKEYKQDIIVLDIVLPNIHGLRLLKAIKAEEDLHNILVIVFSDYSEADMKTYCHDLGADYFFVKQDFHAEEFVSKVLKIIKNRHSS